MMRGMKTQPRSSKPAEVGFGAEAAGGFPGFGRAGWNHEVAKGTKLRGGLGRTAWGLGADAGLGALFSGKGAFFSVG